MTALAVATTLAISAPVALGFTVKDIRIDGISRTEPGTVLSHLPFRVGDEFNDAQSNAAIHALYKSGLFRDVRIDTEGNVVIVTVQERPAVASIDTQGFKAFDKDTIRKSLNNVGLSEGRVFNPATLD
ncbi:MAG TPA: outer membrane protein assembly factor BamA, partial [Sutterella sp.]|nr:outer membrane protein assembly factor BamA [Sutterella sp.]